MLDMRNGEKPGCRAWRSNHTHVSLHSAYVSFPKKSLDWPGSNAHISWHSILNYPTITKKHERGKASDVSYIRDYNFLSAVLRQKVCNRAHLVRLRRSTISDRNIEQAEGEISQFLTWRVRTSKSSNECHWPVSVLGQTAMSKLIIPV